MAHDVVMPMLGMVQDTGIIVAWRKQLGDPVKAGDVLMEVETDKATVEVEAGHDGFLTSLKAATGVPVPVGEVVAVISEDQGAVEATVEADSPAEARQAAPAAPAEPARPPSEPAPADNVGAARPMPAPPPRPAQRPAGGRVLASPKARRLAKERGIDLGRLPRLGVPEPIHVGDLEKAGAAAAGAWQPSVMRVRIERAPFDAFVEWIESEAGVAVAASNLWAAFAAGSLRAATGRGHDDEIVVDVRPFPDTGAAAAFKSPDRVGVSALAADAAGGDASLTVLDLTATMLTEYWPAADRPLPHLTVCQGQDAASFALYLEFDPASMPAETAYAFLEDLANRTQVPLRHLL